jgi:hypothetical protein
MQRLDTALLAPNTQRLAPSTQRLALRTQLVELDSEVVEVRMEGLVGSVHRGSRCAASPRTSEAALGILFIWPVAAGVGVFPSVPGQRLAWHVAVSRVGVASLVPGRASAYDF